MQQIQSNHYSPEELESLRKLAPPRPRSDCFLCDEHPDEIRSKGTTISVRLHYTLANEWVEFPDCASWRIAAFNLETPAYCHQGFAGTFADLLSKTANDLQTVAGNYGPAARETIMRSVYDIERFIHGTEAVSLQPQQETQYKPILFRVRDPSGLARVSIIRRASCMRFLSQLRVKHEGKNHDVNNQQLKQEGEALIDALSAQVENLHPIYQRTFYNRTWEEDKDLGLFSFDNTAQLTPKGQPFTTAKEIADLVRKSKKIVLLSGAGISVESNIKPFRTSSENGQAIWKDFDASKMTVENFNNDDDIKRAWWDMKRGLYKSIIAARPNPAHKFFGLLERMGKLRGIITQNIDSLHLKGGVSEKKIVELHGHQRLLFCANARNANNTVPIKSAFDDEKGCDFQMDFPFEKNPEYLDNIRRLNDEILLLDLENNENPPSSTSATATSPSSSPLAVTNKNTTWLHLRDHVPLCTKCQCPLRTPTIMFGQALNPKDWDAARRMIGTTSYNKEEEQDVQENEKVCDLLFVVGTSLIVAPANDLPGQCLRLGIPVVMINLDSTMYDDYATGLIREPAGTFFAEVARELGVDEDDDVLKF